MKESVEQVKSLEKKLKQANKALEDVRLKIVY